MRTARWFYYAASPNLKISFYCHPPSNLERTSRVLNSFRFKISASGSQNSLMKLTSTGIQESVLSPLRNIESIFSWKKRINHCGFFHSKRKRCYCNFDQKTILADLKWDLYAYDNEVGDTEIKIAFEITIVIFHLCT